MDNHIDRSILAAKLVAARAEVARLEALEAATAGHAGPLDNRDPLRRPVPTPGSYADLLALLPIGISLTDASGNIIASNPVAEQMLGVPAAAHIGRQIDGPEWRIIRPDGSSMPAAEYASVRALHEQRRVAGVEMGIVQPEGEVTWLSVTAAPLPVPGYGVAIAYYDVTERRNTEARLREALAFNELLFEESPDPVVLSSAEGRLVLINRAAEALSGYARADVIGLDGGELGLMDAATWQRMVADGLNGLPAGTPWRANELDLHLRHGRVRRVEARGYPLQIDGQPYYLTTLRDVTERAQAEAALRESEAFNRLLFEEAPEAITVRDAEGRLVRANRAYERLTGCPREALLGRTLAEAGLLPPEEGPRLLDRAQRAWQQGGPGTTEFVLLRADGEPRLVEAGGFPMLIDGQPHGLTTLRDVTERGRAEALLRQREEAVRQARVELERASQAKDVFLAGMSHELRTPLHVMLTYAEILEAQTYGPVTDKQRTAIEAIGSAGQHLLELINDILDVAKIDADKVELDLAVVEVDGTCQAALALVRELAAKQGVTVGYEPAVRGLGLIADGRRLKQILLNLLSNAVKFTPCGGSVRLLVLPDAEGEMLDFAVEDTGIGIAAQDLDRIFAPFEQVNNSYTQKQEGTGLGLALVQRLVELHGGRVQVASKLGQGSRFTVRLPWQGDARGGQPSVVRPAAAAVPEPQPEAANPGQPTWAAARAAQGAVILLVDDNEAVLYAVGEYLQAIGYTVVTARDGLEAIALASTCHPDLILMDIQMPRLSGLEATRRLRADPTLAHSPIVGLSALAMAHDREVCLEAGMVEFVSKPVKLEALAQTLARVLAARGQP